jgi:hypothetical protein
MVAIGVRAWGGVLFELFIKCIENMAVYVYF